MGIYDRDYMRRPRDDGAGRPPQSPAEKLERFFERVLRRHKRWLIVLGLAVAALILIAFIGLKLSQ